MVSNEKYFYIACYANTLHSILAILQNPWVNRGMNREEGHVEDARCMLKIFFWLTNSLHLSLFNFCSLQYLFSTFMCLLSRVASSRSEWHSLINDCLLGAWKSRRQEISSCCDVNLRHQLNVSDYIVPNFCTVLRIFFDVEKFAPGFQTNWLFQGQLLLQGASITCKGQAFLHG